MFRNLLESGKSLVSTSKKLVTSTLDKISDPSTTESYKKTHIYDSTFDEVIKNYELKFEETNLKEHCIASCELMSVVTYDNITTKKRKLHIDLLNLPASVPDQVVQYIGDPNFIIDHTLEVDNNTGTAIAISKNISHLNMTFYEEINFKTHGNKTICNLLGSLAVDLFIGVNETVRAIWASQYRAYYDKYFFVPVQL